MIFCAVIFACGVFWSGGVASFSVSLGVCVVGSLSTKHTWDDVRVFGFRVCVECVAVWFRVSGRVWRVGAVKSDVLDTYVARFLALSRSKSGRIEKDKMITEVFVPQLGPAWGTVIFERMFVVADINGL